MVCTHIVTINSDTLGVIQSVTVEFNGLLITVADIIGTAQVNIINLIN